MMTGVVLGPVVPVSPDMAGQPAEAGDVSFADEMGMVDVPSLFLAPSLAPSLAPHLAPPVWPAPLPAAAVILPPAPHGGAENVSDMAESEAGADSVAGGVPAHGGVRAAGLPTERVGPPPAPHVAEGPVAVADDGSLVARLTEAPAQQTVYRGDAGAQVGLAAPALAAPLPAAPDPDGTGLTAEAGGRIGSRALPLAARALADPAMATGMAASGAEYVTNIAGSVVADLGAPVLLAWPGARPAPSIPGLGPVAAEPPVPAAVAQGQGAPQIVGPDTDPARAGVTPSPPQGQGPVPVLSGPVPASVSGPSPYPARSGPEAMPDIADSGVEAGNGRHARASMAGGRGDAPEAAFLRTGMPEAWPDPVDATPSRVAAPADHTGWQTTEAGAPLPAGPQDRPSGVPAGGGGAPDLAPDLPADAAGGDSVAKAPPLRPVSPPDTPSRAERTPAHAPPTATVPPAALVVEAAPAALPADGGPAAVPVLPVGDRAATPVLRPVRAAGPAEMMGMPRVDAPVQGDGVRMLPADARAAADLPSDPPATLPATPLPLLSEAAIPAMFGMIDAPSRPLDTHAPPTAPRVEAAVPVEALPALVLAQSADGGAAEIHLDPLELGRLRLDIVTEGEVLMVTLSAERGETADLLRRHATELVAELRQAGFAQVNLGFAAWADGRARGVPPAPAAMVAQAAVHTATQGVAQTAALFLPAFRPAWARGLNLRL